MKKKFLMVGIALMFILIIGVVAAATYLIDNQDDGIDEMPSTSCGDSSKWVSTTYDLRRTYTDTSSISIRWRDYGRSCEAYFVANGISSNSYDIHKDGTTVSKSANFGDVDRITVYCRDCKYVSERGTWITATGVINCPDEEYGEWEECSANCDGGTQTRTNSCGDTETRICNTQPCCVTTDWEDTSNYRCSSVDPDLREMLQIRNVTPSGCNTTEQWIDFACATGLVCDGAGDCLVPNGGGCTQDADCVSGLICDNGVCLVPPGGECNLNEDCSGDLVCIEGVCTTQSTGGGICDTTEDCEAGLTCIDNVCVAGIGGACIDDNGCEPGLMCDEGVCLVQAGGACDNNEDCIIPLTCIDGVCIDRSSGGGPCDLDDDDDCIEYIICINGICGNSIFGWCLIDADCQPGLVCDYAEETLYLDSDDNPFEQVSIAGDIYTITIVSATDTTATVTIEDALGNSETIEIGEGETWIALEKIQVGVIDADFIVVPFDIFLATVVVSSIDGFCSTPAGGSCTLNAQCADDLVCIEGVCTTQSTGGGICDDASDCVEGLDCILGICGNSIFGECTSDDDCIGDLVCDNGQCLISLGGSCNFDNQCSGDLVCINTICMNASGTGGECEMNEDCLDGLVCIDSVCTNPYVSNNTDGNQSYIVSPIDQIVIIDMAVDFYDGNDWVEDGVVLDNQQVQLYAGVRFRLDTLWNDPANVYNTANAQYGEGIYRARVDVYDQFNNLITTATDIFDFIPIITDLVVITDPDGNGTTVNNNSDTIIPINFTSSTFPINVTFELYDIGDNLVDTQGPTTVNSQDELPIDYQVPAGLPLGDYDLYMIITLPDGTSQTFFVTTVTVIAGCVDTDGGPNNYFVQGTVTDVNSNTETDKCLSDTILEECGCGVSDGVVVCQSYDCANDGMVCENGACISPPQDVDECDSLSAEVNNKVEELLAMGDNVFVLREGDEIYYRQYTIVAPEGIDGGMILRLTTTDNSSSPIPSDDSIKFTDAITFDVYEAVISEEGKATLNIAGTIYYIEYFGSSLVGQEERYLTLIDGGDISTFYCDWADCIDTDGGLDYGVKGYLNTAIVPGTQFEDYCLDGYLDQLIERHCLDVANPNNFTVQHSCEYACGDDGRCLDPILVTECMNLSEDNAVYVISSDLDVDGDCIVVTGDDVIIDGNGTTMTGNGTGIGIHVTRDNVIIMDLSIANFTYGILLDDVDASYIDNVAVYENDYGIGILGTSDANVLNNVDNYDNNILNIQDNSIGDNFLSFMNEWGVILFTDDSLSNDLTLAEDIIFGTNIRIEFNAASLDNTALPTLAGSAAAISLFQLDSSGLENIRIQRDGTNCNEGTDPSCIALTPLDEPIVMFDVSGWSTYSIAGDVPAGAGDDGGDGGGGGGGGGGVTVVPPYEEVGCSVDVWDCTAWSDCVDDIQTRTCLVQPVFDHCKGKYKPAETQSCVDGNPAFAVFGESLVKEDEKKSIFVYIFWPILILILIILVIYIIWRNKKENQGLDKNKKKKIALDKYGKPIKPIKKKAGLFAKKDTGIKPVKPLKPVKPIKPVKPVKGFK